MRYLQIDGLRGLMLVSMLLSHLGTRLPLGLTHNLVFKSALLNDAASAFVFLSGLTVGLVYTRGWIDPALVNRRSALGARALLVFRHHAFLVVMVTIFAALALQSGRSVWILDAYGTQPLLFGALSLLMLAGGWCLDILPMYVLFLLLTPAALTAVTSGRRWIVIAAVAAAWLIGQAGFLEMGWDALERAFHFELYSIDLGLHFNRLSWSALYFSGLLFGSAYVSGELDLSVLRHPRFAVVLLVCVLTIAGLTLLLLLYLRGIINDHALTFAWLTSKHGLGLLSLLNFIAMAFVVAWLLVAGPTSPYRSMQMLGTGLDKLLRSGPLVLLGQHSLLVFTCHLTAVYAFYLLVDPGIFDPWTANLVLLLGVVALPIPALIGRALKARQRRPSATS